MPCDSRITSSVEWTGNTDVKLLAEAMKSLGYIVGAVGTALRFHNPETGVVGTYDGRKSLMTMNTTRDQVVDMNELKRAYSAQVVKAAAKRFGWQVKQTGEQTYEVNRRA